MQHRTTFIFLTVFLIGSPFFAGAYEFYRDLKLGDEGVDVRALQIILNSRSETVVAETGPGSAGQETLYFGPKTKTAVEKYQEFFRETILSPAGLFVGTGYVGARTRAKLAGEAVALSSGVNDASLVIDPVAAFDARLGSVQTQQPAENPDVPKTEEELIAALEDFSDGKEIDDTVIKDFSVAMAFERYGVGRPMVKAAESSGSSGGGGAGCIGFLLNIISSL